jgi:hypothetical protein
MESIRLTDRGFLRKIGLTLSIAVAAIMAWNAFDAGSSWPGFLFAAGLGATMFLLTRFHSEIIITEGEFIFIGKVWVQIKKIRIPMSTIEKIIETKEGRDKNRYIAIHYNSEGKKKKLKLFADEFPELNTLSRTLSRQFKFEFEEAF